MGTNYYLHYDVCSACNRTGAVVHIGKSSVGWAFSLHVSDEIRSLEDWKAEWSRPRARIVDEYDREISPEEMVKIITERSHPKGLNRHSDCEPAPDGGTYDLVPWEFS